MTAPFQMNNCEQNLDESCGKCGLEFEHCSCCEECEDKGKKRSDDRLLCDECFEFFNE